MDGVAVLLPVLARPHRAALVIDSLRASQQTVPVTPLFLVSPDDPDELEAVKATGADYKIVSWPPEFADYSRKINSGFKLCRRRGYEWIFLGADDLDFDYGWADIALREAEGTDCCVIGTNDGVNVRVRAGTHSTHSFVHRDYIKCGTADENGKIVSEVYGHWYVDDELIQTATYRQVFFHSGNSMVFHQHPNYGRAFDDDTYRKGQSTVLQDQRTYEARKWMWGK